MSGWSNRAWKCPFFGWDERLCIHCEGGKVKFQDRQAAVEYIDLHCASLDGWKRCSIADSLNKYYERKIVDEQ